MRTQLAELVALEPLLEQLADVRRTRQEGALSMPLPFHPRPGTLLMCDFDTGFKAPEMTKKRPVVVISPRRRRSRPKLSTVVPLSTAVPNPPEPYHHRMDPRSVPVELGTRESWAKCDMLYTVSLDRLDRVAVSRGGRRVFLTPMVLDVDLDAIRTGVLNALGLDTGRV